MDVWPFKSNFRFIDSIRGGLCLAAWSLIPALFLSSSVRGLCSPRDAPLLCIKAGTCEWRDCAQSKEDGSCWQELMCVCSAVWVCANGNPVDPHGLSFLWVYMSGSKKKIWPTGRLHNSTWSLCHNLPDFVIGQIAESCAEMPGLNSLDFRRFISVLAQRRSQSLQEFKKKIVLVEVRLS